MSAATTESEKGCCEPLDTHQPFPETMPHMPIVDFPSDSMVWVHHDELSAAAGIANRPEDEFFDARGIPVKPGGGVDPLSLEASGAPHPELQVRFMTALRAMVAQANLDPSDLADAEKRLDWLDDAPDLETMIVASLVDNNRDVEQSGSCTPGCSPWGKLFDKHCCRT